MIQTYCNTIFFKFNISYIYKQVGFELKKIICNYVIVIKLKVLIIVFIFFQFAIKAQDRYPLDYFSDPLETEKILNGNFGESRSAHFHSGIDFKTQFKEGLNVYSSAEGYISRISIKHGGFGKALYINHPNGYTTVYAHLKKFNPRIETYLKKKQYSKKSFDIELFPGKNELKVNEGEIIGYSGNTGGSLGPHLHFEIREANGQIPINPIQYGNIYVEDSRNPQIQSFYLYKGFGPNEKRKEFLLVKKNDSVYALSLIHI